VLSSTSRLPAVETDDRPPRERPKVVSGKRPGIRQQTAYLPEAVYQQLRKLAYEEETKMHDYLMHGLDLVFKEKGLKPIDELTGRED
jgi:hypothetical protein